MRISASYSAAVGTHVGCYANLMLVIHIERFSSPGVQCSRGTGSARPSQLEKRFRPVLPFAMELSIAIDRSRFTIDR